MNTRLLNLLVPALAALICFGTFYYKYRRLGITDYTILAAGVVLLVIGLLSYPQKPGRR